MQSLSNQKNLNDFWRIIIEQNLGLDLELDGLQRPHLDDQ